MLRAKLSSIGLAINTSKCELCGIKEPVDGLNIPVISDPDLWSYLGMPLSRPDFCARLCPDLCSTLYMGFLTNLTKIYDTRRAAQRLLSTLVPSSAVGHNRYGIVSHLTQEGRVERASISGYYEVDASRINEIPHELQSVISVIDRDVENDILPAPCTAQVNDANISLIKTEPVYSTKQINQGSVLAVDIVTVVDNITLMQKQLTRASSFSHVFGRRTHFVASFPTISRWDTLTFISVGWATYF